LPARDSPGPNAPDPRSTTVSAYPPATMQRPLRPASRARPRRLWQRRCGSRRGMPQRRFLGAGRRGGTIFLPLGAVVGLGLMLAVGIAVQPAVAHPGGLDASGCHTNRKTGDHHCHRPGAASREPTPSTVPPAPRAAPSSAPEGSGPRTSPRPPPDTTASCACGSGRICVGPRGGLFCLTPSGYKRYLRRD